METHAAFEGFPFIVGWELTLRCNLRCAHCGSSAGQPRPGELTTGEALEICEQFTDLLVQEVDFTGGEPLLRSDWPVIAERLVKLGIQLHVLTNGLDLTADTVAKMKAVGVSCAGVSLDGLEATHDLIRNRKGSFAAVCRSIKLILGSGLPLNVITTVNAVNLAELPQLLELVRSLGARMWRLQPIIPMGRVRSHRGLQIDGEGILQLGAFIRLHRPALGEQLRLICADGLEYVDDGDVNERPWRGCSAGISACGITSDGKVKGCLSLPDEVTEGDLRRRSLWDIWFDAGSFAYTRGFGPEKLGIHCRDCAKSADCKGGCSSSSYCSTGEFHNDSLCFYRACEVKAGLGGASSGTR